MANEQISVLVPEDRIAEFYEVFGKWLREGQIGAETADPPPEEKVDAWQREDEEEAALVYGRLSPPSRKLFDRLIDSPGKWISAQRLSEHLDIDQADYRYAVAGLLSWPTQYCRDVGRQGFWCWQASQDEEGGRYRLMPEIAVLFSKARDLQT